MSVGSRLRELLKLHEAEYEVVQHEPSHDSQQAARSLHLPGRDIAKVVVICHAGALSLAVLSAHSRVELERLSAALRDEVSLAS